MAPVTRDELSEIRRRLDLIERHLGLAAPAPTPELPGAEPAPIPVAVPVSLEVGPSTAGLLPLAGRAMLALAGAFLLRGFTEAGTLPKSAGVALGLAWAVACLLLARRSAPAAPEARAVVHGLTAGAILAPLLWETTLRLRVLPLEGAAIVLVLFAGLGVLLARQSGLSAFAGTTALGASATAVLLMLGGRQLVLFGLTLTVIAALLEVGALRERRFAAWNATRGGAALALDLGLVLMLSLVTRPGGLPEGYAPAPAGAVVLLLITPVILYGASSAFRTVVHGWRMTPFEMFQLATVLFLFAGGAWLTNAAGPLIAVVCLLAGGAGYAIAFGFAGRRTDQNRNYHAYALFGLVLTGAGAAWLAPRDWWGLVGAVLALATCLAGHRYDFFTLRLHGLLFLLASAATSGLLRKASLGLLGPLLGTASPGTPVEWMAAAAAIAAAVLLFRNLDAPSVGMTVAAFWLAGGLVALTMARAVQDPAWAATLRTGVLSAGALALGWARRRWNLPELQFVVGLVVVVTGLKLLVDDFATGQPLTLCVSLMFFGGALMLVPRLANSKT